MIAQISYINKDGSIDINPTMLPARLRPRVEELVEILNSEYGNIEKVTRQIRHQIDHTTMHWIRENTQINYIYFDKKNQIFEIIPERFPLELRGRFKLYELTELLNLAFYDYPSTDEVKYQMNLFIDDWVYINNRYPAQLCRTIMDNLTHLLRQKFGDQPITSREIRGEVSEYIIKFFERLKGSVVNGSRDQTKDATKED